MSGGPLSLPCLLRQALPRYKVYDKLWQLHRTKVAEPVEARTSVIPAKAGTSQRLRSPRIEDCGLLPGTLPHLKSCLCELIVRLWQQQRTNHNPNPSKVFRQFQSLVLLRLQRPSLTPPLQQGNLIAASFLLRAQVALLPLRQRFRRFRLKEAVFAFVSRLFDRDFEVNFAHR